MGFRKYIDKARRGLSRFEPRFLLSALVILAALWGFADIAERVTERETESFDVSILKSLRDGHDAGAVVGPHWIADAASDLTTLGGWPILTLVVVVVLGFLLLRRAFHEAALVLVATTGGALFSDVLKEIFERARPDVVPHLVDVSSASFPSGHAMLSAVVYLTLGTLIAEFFESNLLKTYALGVAGFLTFVVGLTRVILGVHFPTDVVAGWMAGIVWALGCWAVTRFIEARMTGTQFGWREPEVSDERSS